MMPPIRDHGGNLDAAIAHYGGQRSDWIDLSTGINPVPYPLPRLSEDAWTALPDSAGFERLIDAARRFWGIPDQAAVLALPGASAAISQLPRVFSGHSVNIPTPTYNEHRAAFEAAGWTLTNDTSADAQVAVHPNNPDGRMWQAEQLTAPIRIIDESFAEVCPNASLINLSTQPKTVVLKSLGKFWGLAGLRLGFAIGDPAVIGALKEALGPWQVSGPALQIGTEALRDYAWADDTRNRLLEDAAKLDRIMELAEAAVLGGTALFRLYEVADAPAAQAHLARNKIWSRIFPYAPTWLRLGLPDERGFERLRSAV